MHQKTKLNTPQGAYTVFNIYHRKLQEHCFDLRGKTILNIGPGGLIGVDALFLLHGARRVISLDLSADGYHYPLLDGQENFFLALWEALVREGIVSGAAFWPGILLKKNGRCFYNQERLIRMCPADAAHLPIAADSIDFAFSNAVFEHISRPAQAIAELARVLTPGGHTMHRVDLRDHRDFTRPLAFLKPSEPACGCNLWRAVRYEKAFRQNAFSIRDFEVFDYYDISQAEQEQLRPEFSDLPAGELNRLRFMVYAQKV